MIKFDLIILKVKKKYLNGNQKGNGVCKVLFSLSPKCVNTLTHPPMNQKSKGTRRIRSFIFLV